jgi:hypothetical protein
LLEGSHTVRASAQVRKELRHHIAYLESRITEIDDDIAKTVRRSCDLTSGGRTGPGSAVLDAAEERNEID